MQLGLISYHTRLVGQMVDYFPASFLLIGQLCNFLIIAIFLAVFIRISSVFSTQPNVRCFDSTVLENLFHMILVLFYRENDLCGAFKSRKGIKYSMVQELRCSPVMQFAYYPAAKCQISKKKRNVSPYLGVKLGDSGGLDVLLSKNLHLDRCVGKVEGKVVQEIREVGSSAVDHRKCIPCRSFGNFAKSQLEKLACKPLLLSWLQEREFISICVQNGCPAIRLHLLMYEPAKMGACLQARAANEVVLIREEG